MNPDLNVDLLKRVVKRIDGDRKKWDQGTWGRVEYDAPVRARLEVEEIRDTESAIDDGTYARLDDMVLVSGNACGTAFCLAGHTVLEAGDTMYFESDGTANWCRNPDTGEFKTIEDRAAVLLGFSEEQTNLFDPSWNDFDEFKDDITRYTGVTFE